MSNSSNNSIGIGIFGCNEITRVLAPMLCEKGFMLKAIWDKNKEEAQKFANELKIPYFTDKIDDVLLKKDVIFSFVLCQPYFHSHVVVKSLGIGKHVFIVSPVGLKIDDAMKMVNAANYYPSLITLVNNPLRFLPTFTNMKKLIEEKRIGKLLLIDISVKISSLINEKYSWLSDNYMGGGILNLIGSHIIDLIYYLTNKKAFRVHAIIKTFREQSKEPMRKITSPDFCCFQMELEGGLLITANLQSDQSNIFEHNISVLGESGNLIANSGDLICLHRTEFGDYKEEKLYIDIKDTQSPEIKQIPRMYIKGMNNMIRCLSSAFTPSDSSWNKNSVATAATFENAFYVQKIIEALKKSSVSRSWEKIE
ncbi:hypothetical protein PVAND_001875 [Polypedilum vanderplanki]|uniref:Uncharacterized protein n=1 Tax=Polypedilum vanderplanki TaxID=319348 RepID=A0A9J6BPJ8_POLVA|nr:hypothetical protein PVAND_001875 [Polypedilum vanderplanki]